MVHWDKDNQQVASRRGPTKALLRALAGESLSPPPVWFMRQAGRYLPEYRELRRRSASFLDFCYSPDLAIEATLQPIRRFGFDAAIIFSDILVVPDALGQKVWFEEGKGPRLEALRSEADLAQLSQDALTARLAPVYEALAGTKAALPPETALIGFAGAPWTLATYMLEGSSSRDFAAARRWMAEAPSTFAGLIDLLVEAVSAHLIAQVDAGAEALQIFDSWASALQGEELDRWSLQPITANCAKSEPGAAGGAAHRLS